MSAVTQLDSSSVGSLHTKRVWTLTGSLPREGEVWSWGDAEDLGMTWSDFQWLSENSLIKPVDDGYCTPRCLAEAVRHYVEKYDVDYPGDDPLPRLPEESE